MTAPNIDAAVRAKAVSQTACASYAFRAEAVYRLGEQQVLDKCLAGTLLYDNCFIEILVAHKVEGWVFCAERSMITSSDVYLGAFEAGQHYTFARLCDPGASLQVMIAQFQQWLFNEIMPLFYPTLDFSAAPLRLALLRDQTRVVPNNTDCSAFLHRHPDLWPLAH